MQVARAWTVFFITSTRNPWCWFSSSNSQSLPKGEALQKEHMEKSSGRRIFDPLVNIWSKATRLLVGAVVPACEHHGRAVHLLEHLIEVLLGCLHCRADQRVDVDTGKDLREERMKPTMFGEPDWLAPLHMKRALWRPSFPNRCPSHHRPSPPPNGGSDCLSG